ncbi:MAG: SPFH domain-containing protein, partial [Methanoregula sp.]|nr:SPFH domain-containing protein [Methanoregula sp.]
MRSGATFCSSCGAPVQQTGTDSSATYPEAYPDLSKSNVWQRRPNDLAHRFEVAELNSYFLGATKKITVMQGTKAIFLQGGKYMGDLPPGTYTAGGLVEFLKTLNLFEKTIIILVDDGDIPVDFSIGELRTRENFDAGVKGRMVVKVDKPILLFDNLMKSRPHLEVVDLLGNVRNEMLNVLQSKLKGYSFEDLYGNSDIKKELQQDFEFNLKTTLSRWGLQLVHLPYFDYDESYWQDIFRERAEKKKEAIIEAQKLRSGIDKKIEEMRIEVGGKLQETQIKDSQVGVEKIDATLERKRFDDVTKMIREQFTDDKINQLKNSEDLEKFIHSVDKEGQIRKNEMDLMKQTFAANLDDRDLARRLMIQKLWAQHETELEQIRVDSSIVLDRKKIEF